MSKYLQKPSTVRPKAAVEKALQQRRAASANAVGTGSTVETSEDEKLDQIFLQNYEIAKALLPVVPFRHRKTVNKWMNKLLDPKVSSKSTRNIHLAFLVYQIQKFQIIEPFNADPPASIVVVPKFFGAAKWLKLYKDCEKDNIDFFAVDMPSARQKFTDDAPFRGHIFEEHPQPHNGLVAYGCVFSNHF